MTDDYIVEKIEKGSDEGESFRSYSYRSVNLGKIPLKTKIKLWALVIGGIAVGVVLFLFFITAFIYLFIPVMIALMLWNFFSRRR